MQGRVNKYYQMLFGRGCAAEVYSKHRHPTLRVTFGGRETFTREIHCIKMFSYTLGRQISVNI